MKYPHAWVLAVLLSCAVTNVNGQCTGGGALYLAATSDVRNLSTAGYPTAYSVSQNCIWVIQPSSGYAKLQINIRDFDSENVPACSTDDYAVIFEGTSNTAPQLTCMWGPSSNVINTGATTYVTSITNAFTITFVSDSDATTGRGMWLEYFAYESEESSGLSTGAIVGIVVGVTAVVIITIIVVAVVVYKKKKAAAVDYGDEMDSDGSDYYYDSEDDAYYRYADTDDDAAVIPNRPKTPLAPKGAFGANRRVALASDVTGRENYVKPTQLPALERSTTEMKKRRKRKRREKKRRAMALKGVSQVSVATTSNVNPTTNGHHLKPAGVTTVAAAVHQPSLVELEDDILKDEFEPADQTPQRELTTATVATARDIDVLSHDQPETVRGAIQPAGSLWTSPNFAPATSRPGNLRPL